MKIETNRENKITLKIVLTVLQLALLVKIIRVPHVCVKLRTGTWSILTMVNICLRHMAVLEYMWFNTTPSNVTVVHVRTDLVGGRWLFTNTFNSLITLRLYSMDRKMTAIQYRPSNNVISLTKRAHIQQYDK